jgi:hypothetical protein
VTRIAAAAARSTLLFVDDGGRVVISRDYRGDVGSLRVASFCEAHLRGGSGPLARGDAPPLLLFDGTTFIARRVRRGGGLWLVGATNANANAAACVQLLASLERVFAAYFCDTPPSPGALRGKAALVYALLDEARARAREHQRVCCMRVRMRVRACGCAPACASACARRRARCDFLWFDEG